MKRKSVALLLMITSLSFAPASVMPVYASDVNLKSTGMISYDADGDGTEETLIDSQDLRNLDTDVETANKNLTESAEQLARLKEELGVFKDKLNSLNKNLENNKNNLVSALQNKFTSEASIKQLTEDSSFSDITDGINNVETPTTATGRYYTGGKNEKLTGANKSTLSASNTNTTVNVGDTLNLGIEDSVTLKPGYYPKETTIRNSIINHGNLKESIDYDSDTKNMTKKVAAGYYSGGEITVNAHEHTETYTLNGSDANKASVDMGKFHDFRYLDTRKVVSVDAYNALSKQKDDVEKVVNVYKGSSQGFGFFARTDKDHNDSITRTLAPGNYTLTVVIRRSGNYHSPLHLSIDGAEQTVIKADKDKALEIHDYNFSLSQASTVKLWSKGYNNIGLQLTMAFVNSR